MSYLKYQQPIRQNNSSSESNINEIAKKNDQINQLQADKIKYKFQSDQKGETIRKLFKMI